jgi:hypothetical protein
MTMRIAGVDCIEAGGVLDLAANARSVTCLGFGTHHLPQQPAGSETKLQRVQLTTNEGLSVSSANGSVVVVSPPRISRISPARAKVGTRVVISGRNFGFSVTDVSAVFLGGVQVIDWRWVSESSVEITVPLFASQSQISVLNLAPEIRLHSGYSTLDALTNHTHALGAAALFSYELPLQAPDTSPTSGCAYRDGSGQARLLLTWRDTGLTLLHTKQAWAVHIDSSPQRSNATESVLRLGVNSDEVRTLTALPEDAADCAGWFLSRVQKHRSLQLPHMQSALRHLQDNAMRTSGMDQGGLQVWLIALASTPTIPVWLSVGASSDRGGESTFDGPLLQLHEPLFEKCSPSQYLATQHIAAGQWTEAVCRSCPAGAICNGAPWHRIQNAPGFYRVPWSPGGLGFQPCPIPETCPTRDAVASPASNATSGVLRASSIGDTGGDSACLEGHAGPLCTKCAVGYARLGGRLCEQCTGDGANITLLVIILLLMTCAVLWVVRGQIITRGLGKKQHSVIKKVFLNHLQQVSLMLAFNLKWPNPLKFTLELTDSTSTAGADAASPDCLRTEEVPNAIGSAFRMRVVAAVVTPFALTLVASIVVGAVWWSKRAKSDVAELKRQLTVAVFVVMFVFYTPVTRTAMQLFACQDIGGQMRLSADTAVLCDGPGNNAWQYGLGVPLLLLYVIGLPVTVAVLLWQRRGRLDDASVRRSLGFFYTGYRREYYWYELFVMARKAAFAMILVALSPFGLLWQIGVGSLVVMAALAVSAWLKPFTSRVFNILDTGSMLLSLMTLTGGAVLLQYDQAWEGSDGAGGTGAGGEVAQQAVTVVLTVFNFVFIIGMVVWWLHSYMSMEIAPRVSKQLGKSVVGKRLQARIRGAMPPKPGAVKQEASEQALTVDSKHHPARGDNVMMMSRGRNGLTVCQQRAARRARGAARCTALSNRAQPEVSSASSSSAGKSADLIGSGSSLLGISAHDLSYTRWAGNPLLASRRQVAGAGKHSGANS